MTVLVVPAGHQPTDLSWIERDGAALTWAQVAGSAAIEQAGSPWCIANGIDGLGFVDPRPAPPPPGPDRRAELLAVLDASPLMLDELHEVLRTALTEGLI